jgi:dodecin
VPKRKLLITEIRAVEGSMAQKVIEIVGVSKESFAKAAENAVYWSALHPIHALIFSGMLKAIRNHAQQSAEIRAQPRS